MFGASQCHIQKIQLCNLRFFSAGQKPILARVKSIKVSGHDGAATRVMKKGKVFPAAVAFTICEYNNVPVETFRTLHGE